jgi:hypothetical protein
MNDRQIDMLGLILCMMYILIWLKLLLLFKI